MLCRLSWMLMGLALAWPVPAQANWARALRGLLGSAEGAARWSRVIEVESIQSFERQASLNLQRALGTRARELDPGRDLREILAPLGPEEMAVADRVPEVRILAERFSVHMARLGAGGEAAIRADFLREPLWRHERLRFSTQTVAAPNYRTSLREMLVMGSGPHPVAPAEYADIRDLGAWVLRRFPKERYYYLGVGRSPAPLVAFFEEASIEGLGVKTIPYSRTPRQLPDPARFARHMEEFLPPLDELAGRRLLLIDFTSSGRGLAEFEWMLSGYLKSAGSPAEVRVLALLEGVKAAGLDGVMAENPVIPFRGRIPVHETVPLRRYPVLNRNLLLSGYDTVAEYESFSPKAGAGDPVRNSDYSLLRRDLRKYMDGDEGLRDWLVTTLP